jgi:hypothetical protein
MFNLLDEPRRRQHSCSYLWLIVLIGFDYSPGTKKRRIPCIVVSRLPAVFQRVMLLDYQIELDFASGMYSCNINLAGDNATHINKTIHFRHKL